MTSFSVILHRDGSVGWCENWVATFLGIPAVERRPATENEATLMAKALFGRITDQDHYRLLRLINRHPPNGEQR